VLAEPNVLRLLEVQDFGEIPDLLNELRDFCATLLPRDQVKVAAAAAKLTAELGMSEDLLSWAWEVLERVPLPEHTEVHALRCAICDSINRRFERQGRPVPKSEPTPATLQDYSMMIGLLLRLLTN